MRVALDLGFYTLVGDEDGKKAEELNMPLLKEMNKAVKMIEASIK